MRDSSVHCLQKQQLASSVGVTRQTISLIEKGEYNPSLKLCLSICYTLEQSLDELFWVTREEFYDAKNKR
ncbi:helix-turn-helix transcriptional regulator [Alkalicoccus chagannorensis]|uniref:helix-turn-helix transcriptional regulator n=1 Tax=Alkalicoccus chagannorensis TaxID=427072 RepID=UPI000A009F4E|nr:helix-turn-helix transcriptional regulator [Alkalicoccus chagannorensis]